VSAIDGKGQATVVSSYQVGLSQSGAFFSCIDTIMSSSKKLVPREGDENEKAKYWEYSLVKS
jgi:hypothetical protein